MRLISCHIENFGKFSDFDYNFSDFNAIKAESGFGKTTFADFILAMFFGLKSTTNNHDLRENLRKKYLPWQGGSFGGNLVFEKGGKRYKIERFFGKSVTGDTFKLFDDTTKTISHDFDENIAEQIFGMSEESFSRSAFLSQNTTKHGVDFSLLKKLRELVHATPQTVDFDKV